MSSMEARILLGRIILRRSNKGFMAFATIAAATSYGGVLVSVLYVLSGGFFFGQTQAAS